MENQELIEKKKIMVMALTAAQVLHYALDELKDTDFYRHALKSACNNFEREITKVCDPYIEKLYEMENSARAVHEGVEEIAKAVSKMDPYDVALLGERFKNGKIHENRD